MNGLQRGQVLPLFALCLAALMGFAGLGVDVGYLEYWQNKQQAATDAAAIGAAQQLLSKGCGNQTQATSAANFDAAQNGFATSNPNVTITVNDPPASGPYQSNNCAIQVLITTKNIPTWFSRLQNPFAPGGTETTQAVGAASYTGNGCIFLLTTTQQNDLSNSNMQGPHCSIYMNSSANFSNGTFNFAGIYYAGSGNNVSGATFTKASPSSSLPFADPCPEIPGCEYLATTGPSVISCTAVSGSNKNITTGCYSQLSLSGTDTVCGIIAITGQFHLNNATVNSCGTGVTFYMTNGVSDTNFSSSHLTLSAPTTGTTANILMYRVPSQSSAVDFSTCTCSWSGVVYFPTAKVNVSNVGSGYTVLIFGQGNFSNSSDFSDSVPASGTTMIGGAVLGE